MLSYGGTKNGAMFGEVVVTLGSAAAEAMPYLRKLNMQLASKMRFISAQFEVLLGTGLWLRNAAQANAMAARLSAALREMPGVQVTTPTEANAVFATLDPRVAAALGAQFGFEPLDARTGAVRLMTAFDTTESDVDALVAAIARTTLGS